MKRGEIWTVAGGGDYTGKPRPAVVMQDDQFDDTDSITLCPLTSDPTYAPTLRITVEANADNGLNEDSRLMVDKITTLRKERFGSLLGRLDDVHMVQLNRAVMVFLGLAGDSAPEPPKG